MKGILVMSFILSQVFAKETHLYKTHKVPNRDSVLTLSEAIQRAFDASPRLISASAKVEAAKGSETQAGYMPNPEITFEIENMAGNGPFSGTNSAEYTLGINQVVEMGGKRAARKNAALSAREAVNLAFQIEQLNLKRDVHLAYSNVLAEAESVKLALEQEYLAKEMLATVSKRVMAAAEPETQLAKAQVAYSTRVMIRKRNEQQLEIAKKQLAGLWGNSTLDVALDQRYFFDVRAPTSLQKYQEQLAHIPDMRRFSYLKAEKRSLLKLERAQAIPDPEFSIGVRDFRETGNQALIVGVSMPIPLFNNNRGNIVKAQSESFQIENDERQFELVLNQQLIEQWQHWNTAHNEITHMSNKLIPAAEKAFKLARLGYEKGKFPYLEVLDAQRTLFDTRAQYYDALKRYHNAQANVERLTAQIGEDE